MTGNPVGTPIPASGNEGRSLGEDTAALLSWYAANRRILPWREDPAPYHVWLSEIMLQQTRVEAAEGYYARFMKELPDIPALAASDEELCLKLWEGLGYYSRVRNLRRAAIIVCGKYGGVLPDTAEELVKLPGIGRYTASAIASIACGRKCPAVDGNLLRIFARVTGYEENIRTDEAYRQACSFYLMMMDSVDPEACPTDNPYGDINQALMDLGAKVCIPRGTPDCGCCPLSRSCRAHLENRTEELPRAAGTKQRRAEDRTVFILRSADRVAVRKRPPKGLLAGLYEFPNVPGHLTGEEALEYLKERKLPAVWIRPAGDARHVFSHVEWNMTGYEVRIDEFPENGAEGDGLIYISAAELEERYPVPEAFRAYRKLIVQERIRK